MSRFEQVKWVLCPICGGPDMRKEIDPDGCMMIFCTNGDCASNGGGNYSKLKLKLIKMSECDEREI